jgi:hypothetical protein
MVVTLCISDVNSDPQCMVKIACKCSAGLSCCCNLPADVPTVVCFFPYLPYHISFHAFTRLCDYTRRSVSVTLENHVMPQQHDGSTRWRTAKYLYRDLCPSECSWNELDVRETLSGTLFDKSDTFRHHVKDVLYDLTMAAAFSEL